MACSYIWKKKLEIKSPLFHRRHSSALVCNNRSKITKSNRGCSQISFAVFQTGLNKEILFCNRTHLRSVVDELVEPRSEGGCWHTGQLYIRKFKAYRIKFVVPPEIFARRVVQFAVEVVHTALRKFIRRILVQQLVRTISGRNCTTSKFLGNSSPCSCAKRSLMIFSRFCHFL